MKRLLAAISLAFLSLQAFSADVCIKYKCNHGMPPVGHSWGQISNSCPSTSGFMNNRSMRKSTKVGSRKTWVAYEGFAPKTGVLFTTKMSWHASHCTSSRNILSRNSFNLEKASNTPKSTSICYTHAKLIAGGQSCSDPNSILYPDDVPEWQQDSRNAYSHDVTVSLYFDDKRLKSQCWFTGTRNRHKPWERLNVKGTKSACDDRFSLDADDFFPGIYKTLKQFRSEFSLIRADRDRLEDKYQDDVLALDRFFNELETLSFDNISTNDLGSVEDAVELYSDLQDSLSDLRKEVAGAKTAVKNKLKSLDLSVDQFIADLGIDTSAADKDLALNIPSINIPDVDLGVKDQNSGVKYIRYTDDTITTLEGLYSAGENAQFISVYLQWSDNMDAFREEANNALIPSSSEWDGLNLSVENMKAFLSGKIEVDGWFKDTPATEAQKASIATIKDNFPIQGKLIEDEVKTWRTSNMPVNAFDILIALESIGTGIKEMLSAGQQMNSSVASMVDGAAHAVTEGVKCASKVLLLGDFADLYELTSGKSICTGAMLTRNERIISSFGLIIGNGVFLRGAARAAGLLPPAQKAITSMSKIGDYAADMNLSPKELDDLLLRLRQQTGC